MGLLAGELTHQWSGDRTHLGTALATMETQILGAGLRWLRLPDVDEAALTREARQRGRYPGHPPKFEPPAEE